MKTRMSFFNATGKAVLPFLMAAILALPLAPISALATETKSEEVQVIKAEKTKVKPAEADKAETPEVEAKEGMSTGMMVGIGAGAAALVVVAVAAGGSGGSSDSGPPSAEQVVGVWHAEGVGHVQGKTYTGTYTINAGGTHTYNLVMTVTRTGAQENRVGNGRWYLNGAEFELHNDTGSVYKGTFTNKNSVVVETTNGWWTTTLTR